MLYVDMPLQVPRLWDTNLELLVMLRCNQSTVRNSPGDYAGSGVINLEASQIQAKVNTILRRMPLQCFFDST